MSGTKKCANCKIIKKDDPNIWCEDCKDKHNWCGTCWQPLNTDNKHINYDGSLDRELEDHTPIVFTRKQLYESVS